MSEVGNGDITPSLETEKDSGDTENGCLAVRDGNLTNNRKRDGSLTSTHEIDGSAVSGAKRARMTVDEYQPSVHVEYYSLPRDSKQKLEELLQQWSEWHAQHCSSSHNSNDVLESGKETYFPALHVGLEKSAVSFWVDNQMRNQQSKECVSLESASVPLYDRGYSFGLTLNDGTDNLEGGLEMVDNSRCFNCGSYNHSLKECPKPRNKVAVNKARKQHQSKRNQNSSSRNPTRYYQNSPRGKYDDLRPGVLSAETRKLLSLGELDPPPWLNRMREIGYPPGYLDPEEQDRPSGITIFTDDEIKEEKEDGKIPVTKLPEPPTKMSVEFPGINARIPENADERRWAGGSSSFNLSRNPSKQRSNFKSSETVIENPNHEQIWSRDHRDIGPPGCDPGLSPGLSSYSPRYGGYESSYISHSIRGNNLVPPTPSFGRSLSDMGRRSPLIHAGSSNYGSLPFSSPSITLSPRTSGSPYSSLPFSPPPLTQSPRTSGSPYSTLPFSPQPLMHPPRAFGSGSLENWDYQSGRFYP